MEFAASSGSILSLKSSCEENCELGGYLGNKVGYVLLNLPGTAQRFSPMDFIVADPASTIDDLKDHFSGSTGSEHLAKPTFSPSDQSARRNTGFISRISVLLDGGNGRRRRRPRQGLDPR